MGCSITQNEILFAYSIYAGSMRQKSRKFEKIVLVLKNVSWFYQNLVEFSHKIFEPVLGKSNIPDKESKESI